MARSFKFGILNFASHPMRGERLNVGVLVLSEDGFQVRCPPHLEKLKAISAALDIAGVERELRELPSSLRALGFTRELDGTFAKNLSRWSQFGLCQTGSFDAPSSEVVELQINDLMQRYVVPEPTLTKPVKKRTSRLRSAIRQTLMAEKILARPAEGLDSHRVIYQHRLADGVVADFVLRNGAMHVAETVDLSTEGASLHRGFVEIATSALTFEHARIVYENHIVKPRLIYQATATVESALAPSLYAVQHQGAEIINWSSQDQREQFIGNWAALAESSEDSRKAPALFHASSLPRQKLN